MIEFLRHQLLWLLIFLPLAGAVAAPLIPRRRVIRGTALGVVLAELAAALLLSFALDWRGGRTFVYGGLGIDGLNFSLTLATAGMFLLAIIASWKIERAAIAHFAALLLLEAAMVGGFLAVDFSLYWLFTTVSLAVVLVAVGVGGGPQRQWAASKFFLFALGSSMVLLAAMPRATKSGALGSFFKQFT